MTIIIDAPERASPKSAGLLPSLKYYVDRGLNPPAGTAASSLATAIRAWLVCRLPAEYRGENPTVDYHLVDGLISLAEGTATEEVCAALDPRGDLFVHLDRLLVVVTDEVTRALRYGTSDLR